MTLFLKECKKVLFSIPFLIFIIAMVIFSYGQGVFPRFENAIEKPIPNQESYGMKSEEIPKNIIPLAIDALFFEFSSNQYTTYPIGFYKSVKLNNNKQAEIAKILSKLSGMSVEKLNKSAGVGNANQNSVYIGDGDGLKQDENGNYIVDVPKNKDGETSANIEKLYPKQNLTYAEFKKEMCKADKILGGGSKYGDLYLVQNFGQRPITYEEALTDYNAVKSNDKFTGAYARLSSDYMGLILALLSVFIAVAVCMKDRRFKMNELIYARKSSSFSIVVIRYCAMVAMIMLPTILLIYISNISMWGFHAGETLDYLAPLKYSFGWLMPSVMISTAVGMFFTTLTDTPIAIAIQGLWWFININSGVSDLSGNYSLFSLSPRHNILGNALVFIENINALILNRAVFAGISILLIILTALIYEKKRKGYLNGYEHVKSVFSNHKNKLKA